MLKASCPSHPSRAAVAICGRCGKFVCGDCLELAGEVSLCLDCHGRARGGWASGTATASLVLGIVGLILGGLPGLIGAARHFSDINRGVPFPFAGLICGLLPGLVGLFLATRELAAIARRDSPQAGAGRARVGRVLGYCNLGLLAAVIAWALVLGARGHLR
ncbi:MAG: hypothetical protein ACYC8T_27220 [Myxococcaceae bacterium]